MGEPASVLCGYSDVSHNRLETLIRQETRLLPLLAVRMMGKKGKAPRPKMVPIFEDPSPHKNAADLLLSKSSIHGVV